jgi:hypothetical protein
MSLPEGEDVTAPPFPGHRQAPRSGFGVKNVQGMYQRQNEPKLLCRLSHGTHQHLCPLCLTQNLAVSDHPYPRAKKGRFELVMELLGRKQCNDRAKSGCGGRTELTNMNHARPGPIEKAWCLLEAPPPSAHHPLACAPLGSSGRSLRHVK